MTATLDDVRYLVGEWFGRATSGDPPLEVRTIRASSRRITTPSTSFKFPCATP